jgi:hypothetical protein
MCWESARGVGAWGGFIFDTFCNGLAVAWNAGDNRTIAWPERSKTAVPLGQSGAVIESGTDHVRGTVLGGVTPGHCHPWCLFNLTADLNEANDLSHDPAFRDIASALSQRLDEAGMTGPPPAYIWPDQRKFQQIVRAQCATWAAAASVQPVDWK